MPRSLSLLHPFIPVMNRCRQSLREWLKKEEVPAFPQTHGELSASARRKKHLKQLGLKYLTANFRSRRRGEIDLVFRDEDCLVFVEVKTRSSEDWVRPAAYVDKRKRRLLCQTALDYLRLLKNPPVKIRFDIVEVLFAGEHRAGKMRHLPNTFVMEKPYRYG